MKTMKRLFPMFVLLVLALGLARPALAQQAGDLDGPMTENPGYNHPPPPPVKKTVAPPIQDPAANDLPNTPLPKESPRPREAPATGGQADAPSSAIPQSSPAPRSDNESSSEASRADISAPPEDEKAHPGSDSVAGELLHQREWNPLRCMKDVEVATFYYKQGNYKAALSRLREALEYKPHDAVATFHLAQTLEKLKQYDEARLRYEEYLTILKDGPFAAESHKALARLDAEAAAPPASHPAEPKP